ncbi:MAG: hypothetical protein JJ863_26165 [Deltaproteobacteria bacterium]|nr:hypothetical protein [Deltaproteobacteria bacterium]
MIRYEPHPRWIQDIVRLPISYALRRALYGMLLIGAYASLVVWLMDVFDQVELPHGAAAFGVLGGAISLGLGFRLNNAYARWWEGRQHWGLLINHCRNLAGLVQSMWAKEDASGRQRMAGLVGDFVIGLSADLRGELDLAELETLTADEREEIAKRGHPLSYVSQLVWSEIEQRHRDGVLGVGELVLVQPHARALLDVLGACERIRKTPIPFALTSAIRAFLLLFALLIPLGLHDEFGWLAVPISMFAFYALAVMDVLAAELEDPFGLDCNDLPTRSMAEMIRRQVHELLGVTRDGAPDRQPASPALYAKFH